MLVILGLLYGLYIFYLGIPIMLGTAQSQVITYFIVTLVVTFVVYFVISYIIGAVTIAAFGLGVFSVYKFKQEQPSRQLSWIFSLRSRKPVYFRLDEVYEFRMDPFRSSADTPDLRCLFKAEVSINNRLSSE